MILARLIGLITPVACVDCGVLGDVFCTTCVAAVKPDLRLVGFGAPTKLAGVSVGAFYDGPVKELILQLKFHRLRSADVAAAALVMRAIPAGERFDVVTSVPVSPLRYRERGYNQSELVAKRVARELGLPYRSMLGRTTSAHQMGGDRAARLRQIAGAFFAFKPVGGQRVLVIDDVITTGATLSECATTLSEAGAASVWGAVIARH